MSAILGPMLKRTRFFEPRSIPEYVGMQLARTLGEPHQVLRWCVYCTKLPLADVIAAYRETIRSQGATTHADRLRSRLDALLGREEAHAQ